MIIIKNIKNPICEKCLHFRNFIPDGVNYEYSSGVCMKFGEKNMITGKIKYNYAIDCRNDVSKCGKDAIYFTPLKPEWE
jgi:hypothetical protein